MQDFGTKTNNSPPPGGQLSADEFNNYINELENSVTRSGQALNGASITQLATSLFLHSVKSEAFQDSGVANAYVGTPVSGINGVLLPADYAQMDGAKISFIASNANSGNSTLNIGQTTGTLLGAKKLLTLAGAEIPSGTISAGMYVTAQFNIALDSANGAWVLTEVDNLNAAIATVAAASTINLTTGAPNTIQLAISGTGVTINGFTVAANRWFFVKMTGASNTLVNSASLVTGRGANIQAVAGDTFLMRATSANTVEILGYSLAPGYLHVQDQKAQNTPGGSATVGVQTRVLNTTLINTIAGASLASNQITLPAGTYDIKAWATVRDVDRNRAALYNVTDAAIAILGSSEDATTNLNSKSVISGRLTITATKVFEVRHYCQLAVATNGLGIETNFAGQEIYADVEVERVI